MAWGLVAWGLVALGVAWYVPHARTALPLRSAHAQRGLYCALQVHSYVQKQFHDAFLVDDCTPVGYWLWYWSVVPVLSAVMLLTAVILKRRHLDKEAAGFNYL